MPNNETTTSYIELSSHAYKLGVDAGASALKRILDYTKSISEITLRPPSAATTVDAHVREFIDRANQVVLLTATELQTTGQKNTELAQKAAEFASRAHDTLFNAARGLSNTGISNLNYVKETTSAHLDTFAKRVDEIQTRAAAAAGVSGTPGSPNPSGKNN